jgi:hypothetical protein
LVLIRVVDVMQLLQSVIERTYFLSPNRLLTPLIQEGSIGTVQTTSFSDAGERKYVKAIWAERSAAW